jgi:hypothetical protein
VSPRQENQRLSEIVVKPAFRTVDGLSVRFAESDQRGADALLSESGWDSKRHSVVDLP